VSARRPTTLRRAVRRVVVGQAAALLALTLICLGVFAAEYRTAEESRSDERELLLIQTVRAEILTAQSSHRGYVLVGRQAFLEPYRAAVPAVDRTLANLAPLEDDAARVADELERRFNDWRAMFAEPTLRLLDLGRRRDALAIIRSGTEGKRRIDAIKRVIARAAAHEERELDELLARQQTLGNIGRGGVVLACVGVLLFGATLLRGLRRRVIEPVGELAGAAQRLGDGDLSARVPVDGAHEVAVVGRAFNEMAADVERHVAGLQELAEAKSQFVSSVTHELRGPLTSIRGYAETLLDPGTGQLNEDQQLSAQLVHRNAARMQRIVNDLLELSRLEAGSVRLTFEPVDLRAVLEALIDELQPQLTASGVEVALDCEPGIAVEADPLLLHQALGNLLSNALKFSEHDGKIRVSARRAGEVVVAEFTTRASGSPRASWRVSSSGSTGPRRRPAPRAPDWAWRSPRR
jgi:two-component system, OmpR family, sensor kinase